MTRTGPGEGTIHAWGGCHPQDCDWGERRLILATSGPCSTDVSTRVCDMGHELRDETRRRAKGATHPCRRDVHPLQGRERPVELLQRRAVCEDECRVAPDPVAVRSPRRPARSDRLPSLCSWSRFSLAFDDDLRRLALRLKHERFDHADCRWPEAAASLAHQPGHSEQKSDPEQRNAQF